MVEQPPGLLENILSQPYIWILFSLLVIYFIVAKFMDKKGRPEQKPFYGVDVREGMTRKQLGKHIETWGDKIKFKLYRGMVFVGYTVHVNPIYKYPNADEVKDFELKDSDSVIETYAISFRKKGFMAWLKAMLLHEYDKMLIDPKALRIDHNKKTVLLDPKTFMIDDSGVWSIATKKELKIIDDLNLKKDHENVKGFVSDFPRRLSNLDPNQSIKTEQLSHYYAEEEKAKRNRISQWSGKSGGGK